jgi:hypothetical protein
VDGPPRASRACSVPDFAGGGGLDLAAGDEDAEDEADETRHRRMSLHPFRVKRACSFQAILTL